MLYEKNLYYLKNNMYIKTRNTSIMQYLSLARAAALTVTCPP